jgi:hypothetical protein
MLGQSRCKDLHEDRLGNGTGNDAIGSTSLMAKTTASSSELLNLQIWQFDSGQSFTLRLA